MRKVTKHIVHCSDTLDGRECTVADIDKWHREKGWKGIGYHFVIYKDGSLHRGRLVDEIGAHCEGQNTESIGTCLIGRTMFTEVQYDTLRNLHETLKSFYPDIEAFGHHDFNPKKTCPNFDINQILT